jgi:hypothetical protein
MQLILFNMRNILLFVFIYVQYPICIRIFVENLIHIRTRTTRIQKIIKDADMTKSLSVRI